MESNNELMIYFNVVVNNNQNLVNSRKNNSLTLCSFIFLLISMTALAICNTSFLLSLGLRNHEVSTSVKLLPLAPRLFSGSPLLQAFLYKNYTF